MKSLKKQPKLHISFSTPTTQASCEEHQRRLELSGGIDCLTAHFESLHQTDVVRIELFPDDSEDLIQVEFWSSPRKLISVEEQQARQYLKTAIETMLLEFQGLFRTEVTAIELHPCVCKLCKRSAA